ncbi:lactoylglutathione lyase [Sphingomonas panacisoli]|uniref:Lactoylglutathione lyase n=1 Tax=Sphingomonas panacisoli TaxID=1813879 RepID=A0A5B8LJF1_9SPHN|nr:VOC family protein [Sphingomonas panacisoli]QDZ08313.1 lactoylglutathione lyase [Sphingomonas panacisoli]
MTKMIFVNLPVADVAKSTAFYEAIGFTKNEQFSNEQASSMVWSDSIFVMLLAKPFFSTFTPKTIGDAKTTASALFALSFDSKADVDTITDAASAAGGTEPHGPEDMGFMYSRAFEDLDGHGWGPFWMDPAAAEAGPPEHQPIVEA